MRAFPSRDAMGGIEGHGRSRVAEAGIKREREGSSGVQVSYEARRGRGYPEETTMWPTWVTLATRWNHVLRWCWGQQSCACQRQTAPQLAAPARLPQPYPLKGEMQGRRTQGLAGEAIETWPPRRWGHPRGLRPAVPPVVDDLTEIPCCGRPIWPRPREITYVLPAYPHTLRFEASTPDTRVIPAGEGCFPHADGTPHRRHSRRAGHDQLIHLHFTRS
jgi:hypothetical protein